MQSARFVMRLGAVVWLAAALAGTASDIRPANAQPQSPARANGPPASAPRDPYQRSLEIFEFRKAAPSGPERGREIFYYKCWFCHNEFAQDGGPDLRTLYKRSRLLSGPAVSDESVKQEIRNGGPGMAAYKYTLSEADLNDLVSFIKSECCWNSESPPANPRYRAR